MFELINFLTLFLIVLHTIVFVTISPRQRRVGGRNTVNDYQSSGCAFYAAFPPFSPHITRFVTPRHLGVCNLGAVPRSK